MKTYAVVTGDLIASSRLDKKSRKEIPSILRKIFGRVKKHFPDDIEDCFDVFGGDSWQMAVKNFDKSLRIVLCFRLLLKAGIYGVKTDSKISIAVGGVDFISKNKLSESDGDAFRASGRNLENLNKNFSMYFELTGFDKHDEFQLFMILLDSIISRYTEKQSLAVFGKLVNLNQQQISKLFKTPVKQQTVSKHINSANWYAVEKTVDFYEYNLKSL